MYKYFCSKKGFTLVELLICVVILAILSGVAVPIIDKKQKKQKMIECENNCQMIETIIKEAMAGMMDNGKQQIYYTNSSSLGSRSNTDTLSRDDQPSKAGSITTEKLFIYTSHLQSNRQKQMTGWISGIGSSSCKYWPSYHMYYNNRYIAQNYWALKLCYGSDCFTFGELRGGYRPTTYSTYAEGCNHGYYLKKSSLSSVAFYKYLPNEQIPVCPFDKTNTPTYYVLCDGRVFCGCTTCMTYKANHSV